MSVYAKNAPDTKTKTQKAAQIEFSWDAVKHTMHVASFEREPTWWFSMTGTISLYPPFQRL